MQGDCRFIQLGSLPAEIWQLTGLHTLALYNCNQLGSLPAEIGQLTGLHTLNLTKCTQLATFALEGLFQLRMYHLRV